MTDGSGNAREGERTTRGEGSTLSAFPLRRSVIARRAFVKWRGSKLPLSTSTATSSIRLEMISKGSRHCQLDDAPSSRFGTWPQGPVLGTRWEWARGEQRVVGPPGLCSEGPGAGGETPADPGGEGGTGWTPARPGEDAGPGAGGGGQLVS